MRNRIALAIGVLMFATTIYAFAGPPISVVEAVRDSAIKVGPAFPRAERITCDTTAGGIAIQPAGGLNLISYECTAKGAVVVGSKTGAGAALTTANGVEYASGDRFGANVQTPERCITTAGSTVLQCRFLVSAW